MRELTPIAPPMPGSYVLIMRLDEDTSITVGRLGQIIFPEGWYAYTGSALGSGGLAGRLQHHMRPKAEGDKKHWHIDYLLQHAELVEIWTLVGEGRKECLWAKALRNLPGAKVVAPNFGATDCRCLTHLVHFNSQITFPVFSRVLVDTEL